MSEPVIRKKEGVIERFLEHCHRRTHPAKQLIIKEGDYSTELFYIISGSVTVLVEDDKGRENAVPLSAPKPSVKSHESAMNG